MVLVWCSVLYNSELNERILACSALFTWCLANPGCCVPDSVAIFKIKKKETGSGAAYFFFGKRKQCRIQAHIKTSKDACALRQTINYYHTCPRQLIRDLALICSLYTTRLPYFVGFGSTNKYVYVL